MNKEVVNIITQIARIRNVDISYVAETLKTSIIAGLKRRFGEKSQPEVEIFPETGELRVFLKKKVVSTVLNPSLEIEKQAAIALLNRKVRVGETVRIELPLSEIGRIAIRKASDELIQKLGEAARNKLYEDFNKKRNEIVTGTVQKITQNEVIVNLGLAEATLLNRDQLRTDSYRQGMPIKAYLSRIEKTPLGPKIFLSRTQPDFLKKLLIKEIPEIREGVVEIKGIARAPGYRSKVAVFSTEDKIDPVGACVGYRKSRIDNIIKELSGEKIDIVLWSKDPLVFVARALGPAKVLKVIREDASYYAIVPDSELSIAIGKKGQNVGLASSLVGSKVEVMKASDFKNRIVMDRAQKVSLLDLELPDEVLTKLQDAQILTGFDLLQTPTPELVKTTSLDEATLEDLKKSLRERLASE